jgi:hypothetical protein
VTQFDRPFLCFTGIEDPLFGISCRFTLRHEPLNISDNVCEVVDVDWCLRWYNCGAVQLDVSEALCIFRWCEFGAAPNLFCVMWDDWITSNSGVGDWWNYDLPEPLTGKGIYKPLAQSAFPVRSTVLIEARARLSTLLNMTHWRLHACLTIHDLNSTKVHIYPYLVPKDNTFSFVVYITEDWAASFRAFGYPTSGHVS